jgi:hypothetical protein
VEGVRGGEDNRDVTNSDVETTTPAAKPVKRPRHLMDPDNPVRMAPSGDRKLSNVQKWVLSVLAVFTIAHLSVGMVLASLMVKEDQIAAKIGLSVIGGIFLVLGIGLGFVIHRKSPLTPWLLIGVIPAAVGIWLALR